MKTISILVTSFCCTAIFIFAKFTFYACYNPLKPGIDTYFSINYNEEKFNSIEVGTDGSEVLRLIGLPLYGSPSGIGPKDWHYSYSKHQNYDAKIRILTIGANGKVSDVIKYIEWEND